MVKSHIKLLTIGGIIELNKINTSFIFLLVVFFVIVIFAGAASAATIKVNNSTPNAIGKAINIANSGDTLYLSAGNYYEHDLTISKSLTISGPSTNSTPKVVIDAQKQGRIFNIASGNTLNLKYAIIQNGYVAGLNAYGGALRNNGKLTIKNCQILQNTANMGGGGIVNSGTCIVTDSVIYYNTAENDGGGGIYNSGTCKIYGSNIYINEASGGTGGGIRNFGTCTINDSHIFGNSGDAGGGINNSGKCAVIDSIITNNTAASNSGGGIRNMGTFTMTGSTLYGNSAEYGGGIYDMGTSLKVSMCDFINNKAATKEGNAIFSSSYFNSGTVIRYCRFNDNYSGYEIYSSGVSIDVRYNWWGSNNNPSSKKYGKVSYNPWILDITGVPTVSSSNPANGATKVARNQTITINFNEYLRAGDNFNVELKTSTGKVIPISKSLNGKTLTIKPSSKLAANTKYIIYLHTGCITDYKNNKMAAKSIKFTTGSS